MGGPEQVGRRTVCPIRTQQAGHNSSSRDHWLLQQENSHDIPRATLIDLKWQPLLLFLQGPDHFHQMTFNKHDPFHQMMCADLPLLNHDLFRQPMSAEDPTEVQEADLDSRGILKVSIGKYFVPLLFDLLLPYFRTTLARGGARGRLLRFGGG